MNNRESLSNRMFTRRVFFIGALQVSLLALLAGRLAQLQISQGARYQMLSDKNRINIKMLPPPRGQIVDRYGVPLAVNNQSFRVQITREQTDSMEKSLRNLQKFIQLDDKKIENVLAQAKKTSKFIPVEVKNNLTWEEVAKIEVNLPDLPGLSIGVGEVRSYPFGEASAHIIGYVGAAAKTEVSDDPILKLPGFKVGKTGIEKTYDKEMRGVAGAAEVEVNVVGREVRELSRNESRPGNRVILTIDGELQRIAQARLAKERSASAVIMDAKTGAVYALASHPSFDPNEFSRGISAAVWEEMLANPGLPLTNKAIAGQYPPASTFKMITGLAGLRAGKITPGRTVYCPGHYQFGDTRFHCWRKGGHGYVDFPTALERSCDTFFYEISTEVGIDAIAEMAREFGLGSKLGFDLSEETPGLVPDVNWKKAYLGQNWHPGETIVASIGQGYLLATPLQLANMTARLVNGGKAVKPWITAYVGERPGVDMQWPDMNIDSNHMAMVRTGMDRVVNNERGTAYGSRILEPETSMGGKTGTAQVRRITMAQRAAGVKNEDLPWKQRHHGLFVGYAPLHDPRYVCAVVVEHGVGGSTSAAPVAKELLIEVQRRNPAASMIKPEIAIKQAPVRKTPSVFGPFRPRD
jgi:penicillin-binding protein 2